MGVDDLFRAVFFRHVRKAAAPLQNVGGRVVERIPCGYEIDGCRIERRLAQILLPQCCLPRIKRTWLSDPNAQNTLLRRLRAALFYDISH